MDKTQILSALQSTGDVGRFTRTPNWDKAFDLYNQATNNKKKPNCSACYRAVLKWLQS